VKSSRRAVPTPSVISQHKNYHSKIASLHVRVTDIKVSHAKLKVTIHSATAALSRISLLQCIGTPEKYETPRLDQIEQAA